MKPWKVQWSRLRSLQIIKHARSNRKVFDFAGACKVKIDYDKYRSSRDNYLTGLNNYTVFQKFSNFRWPAWINAITDTSRGASSLVPHMLVNSAMRDCLYFTNFLSDDGLYAVRFVAHGSTLLMLSIWQEGGQVNAEQVEDMAGMLTLTESADTN